MTMMPSDQQFHTQLRQADTHLRQRHPQAAIDICKALIQTQPGEIPPRLILARAKHMLHDHDGMLAAIAGALKIDPANPDARLMQAEALIGNGDILAAKTAIADMLVLAKTHAGWLGRIAEMQTQISDHEGALETLLRAQKAAGGQADTALLYNLASAYIAVGEMEKAEDCLDRLISIKPDDYDAYYNRATLRKQTPDSNHVDELETALAKPNLPPMGEVQLSYALAKELEDLGAYDDSFAALRRGADKRRANMQYKAEDDIETMQLLQSTFAEDFFAKKAASCSDTRPVFIIGLPRSGTTLTDRILSAHPDVKSLGEINDLAMAITRLCAGARTKSELIARSAGLDMQMLGAAYVKGFDGRGVRAKRVIDKTPLNFLYAGLIAKALPHAVMIHVTRSPMDVGYAMYKTLFRMGYPFSYDQQDLARYMLAKDRLMAHWHDMMPGRIIDIAYEDLIADQEGKSRAMIAALGLDWDPACLDFHKNKSASATASAAQVRQPIYGSSVGKWEHFKDGLAPLKHALKTRP